MTVWWPGAAHVQGNQIEFWRRGYSERDRARNFLIKGGK